MRSPRDPVVTSLSRMAAFSSLARSAGRSACSGFGAAPVLPLLLFFVLTAFAGCRTGLVDQRAGDCGAGLVSCNDECVNVQVDPAHCGGCDRACASRQLCIDGGCLCPSPLRTCGAACVDTGSDPANCGGCGNACLSGQRCQGGACVAACNGGNLDCAGHCIDPNHDDANCGACGVVCPRQRHCSNGSCVCGPGETECGGACAALDSDPDHCGDCAIACAPAELCSLGRCARFCDRSCHSFH